MAPRRLRRVAECLAPFVLERRKKCRTLTRRRDRTLFGVMPCEVGAVVCIHAKAMKEPWCLAASDAEASTAIVVNHYARRWTIKPCFRDTKDLRFAMGLGATRVGEPTRRGRPLLINAVAMVLLTMLGADGEKPRHGSIAEVQYIEDTCALVVPQRLFAL